jgi:hypothetical protein
MEMIWFFSGVVMVGDLLFHFLGPGVTCMAWLPAVVAQTVMHGWHDWGGAAGAEAVLGEACCMEVGCGEDGTDVLGASWTLFCRPHWPVGHVEHRTGLLTGVTCIWRISHEPLD